MLWPVRRTLVRRTLLGSGAALVLLVFVAAVDAENPAETPAERGYRLLTTKSYLPPDFDQEVFDELWRTWEEPLRTHAERATPEVRRRMAFARYGLSERPGEDGGKPLQYVVDERGNWVMNCFACHGGEVAGQVVPGAPNTHFALQTLTEDVRRTKLRLDKPLGRMDVASTVIPLGGTVGTTNAVMFGVVLLNYRDAALNVHADRPAPKLRHHDMDAPPWWHYHKRKQIYIDGFAPKGHRALMQFLLVRENGPEKFHQWEDDFRQIEAYLNSLRPPKYPFEIDEKLAEEGRIVFNQNCARCHGRYDEQASYPSRMVSLEEIGTDPVRYAALTAEHRRRYGQSWFAEGELRQRVVDQPKGYVAPPLDGVWASAPYLHSGSVPTLWHLLHPDQRPQVWRRNDQAPDDEKQVKTTRSSRSTAGYDRRRVGLAVDTLDEVPQSITVAAQMRQYFDTRRYGKSASGHLYPDRLSEPQKRAVLEYLKTL